ncbi:hypothetical protein [uncultured Nostoc sp.]|uniref:hypothetical protein n=1 Tax=uncultured Nostoc sp. TaxID=340711 RepID=UPI0035C960D0
MGISGEAITPRNNLSEAIFFKGDQSGLDSPNLFVCQAEVPKSTAENVARFGLPDAGWTLFGAVAHPKNRGRLRLTGSNPSDPIMIDANTLSDPDDLKAAIAPCKGGHFADWEQPKLFAEEIRVAFRSLR